MLNTISSALMALKLGSPVKKTFSLTALLAKKIPTATTAINIWPGHTTNRAMQRSKKVPAKPRWTLVSGNAPGNSGTNQAGRTYAFSGAGTANGQYMVIALNLNHSLLIQAWSILRSKTASFTLRNWIICIALIT